MADEAVAADGGVELHLEPHGLSDAGVELEGGTEQHSDVDMRLCEHAARRAIRTAIRRRSRRGFTNIVAEGEGSAGGRALSRTRSLQLTCVLLAGMLILFACYSLDVNPGSSLNAAYGKFVHGHPMAPPSPPPRPPSLLASGATPWPLPRMFDPGNTILPVDPTFSFSIRGSASAVLAYAAADVAKAIISAPGAGCGAAPGAGHILSKCAVVITSDAPLTPGVDESYTLDIALATHLGMQLATCTLRSPTTWGALHGLESMRQLAGENCTVSNAPLSIADAPRFGYRGLMIDTARHFMPVWFLKHIIDGMALHKLNVMHWHIVDDTAFPFVSSAFPHLSDAAYAPQATYSASDIQGLLAYAEAKGVRIMPEFDMPGHGDWTKGAPEVMVTDGPCNNTMDPTKDATYDFIARFLKEVTDVFPDPYLFLGGDEVQGHCWAESPSVSSWMAAHNMTTEGLSRHFWQQMSARVLPSVPRRIGVWEDDKPQPHPEDLPPNAFGNVWQGQSTMKTTVGRKFDSILSGPWYLDMENPGTCKVYALQQMWRCFYDVEPLAGLSAVESSYVLGGQACQWSEGINQHNFDGRTWTNAAAVAERLWSSRAVNSTSLATPRLVEHVCRLNTRGFRANPIDPSWCATADNAPKA